MGRQKNKKNPKGGKKHKSKASKDYKTNVDMNRLPFKDEKSGQQYALVLNRLGGNRLCLQDELGLEIQGVIPGRFRKKVWFNTDDIALIQSRSFNENEYDIIYKYNDEEVKILKKLGHIKTLYKKSDESNMNDEDSLIQFTDKIDEDEEELINSYEELKKSQSKTNSEINLDDI